MYSTEHQEDIDYGESIEIIFKEYMTKKGFDVKKSSTYNDKIDHFDFIVTDSKHKSIRVDVKGLKRKNKQDPFTNDTWVEFVGVSGYSGWIYGDAKYIIFYRLNGTFISVDRLKLIEEVTKEFFLYVNKNGHHRGEKEYFQLHDRRKFDNKDLMTFVPSYLIEKIGKII